ncbi:MAG: OmpA family protein [Longimicrobiales bacterium]
MSPHLIAGLTAALLTIGIGAAELRPTSGEPPDSRVPGQQQPEEPDLLTFARGLVFVGQEGLATGSASRALLATDGDAYRLGLTSDSKLPIEFTYQLPAPTTFNRFAIPSVEEWPGNVTFVKNVTVSGSNEGPGSGFEVLAEFELETHGAGETVTEIMPVADSPVRWIKIHFDGGINIEAGDEGRTNIRFTELIGNGVQEATGLSATLDGIWDLRQTERMDRRGRPLVLRQQGTAIQGCYGDYRISGTVNGLIARATGEDPTGRPVGMILVSDEDGTIHGSISENRGRFHPRTSFADPALEAPDCLPEETVEPAACGTNAYINFDLNSAVIRPESQAVLADVLRGLQEEDASQVTIVGHTSSEGEEAYNLALSERRAQAVVDELVALGFPSAAISAAGMGESQLLTSPDPSETARELNRRVEIGCA